MLGTISMLKFIYQFQITYAYVGKLWIHIIYQSEILSKCVVYIQYANIGTCLKIQVLLEKK